MSEPKWEEMNEEEFDILLKKSFSDALPKSVAKEVTPWKKAMRRVFVGLILSTVTLNFFSLDSILPTVGAVLLLLGFRALRNDNKHFKACFIFSVAQTACYFQLAILGAALSDDGGVISKVTLVLGIARTALMIVQLFCLWRAFAAVKEAANMPKKATPAAVLLICYVLICVCGVVNMNSPIVVIPLFILYLVSIYSVYKLSKWLDSAGYVIEPAWVKLSDKWIVLIIATVLTVGCALGYIFDSGYDMKWESAEAAVTSKVQATKDDLLNLGFPSEVLYDLTDKEIDSLNGALEVVCKTTYKAMNDSGLEEGDLTVTTVAVKLPNEVEKWTVIHHFSWRDDIDLFGTHLLQIWPAYQYSDDGWAEYDGMTGRVLYDEDGKTFTAPYYSLENKTYTASGSFFNRTSTDAFAEFSLPKKGENRRGYVTYSIVKSGDTDFFSSWLNYTYQKCALQYPVKSAMQTRLESTDNKVGAFRTAQYSFLYTPDLYSKK